MASSSVLGGAGDDQPYTINTSKLDPLLRCYICKCYWRHPRTLKDCLHTFCKPCLYDWFRERGGMCPEPGCNTAFRLVEGLPRGGDVHKDTQKRDFLRQYMVACKYFPVDWHEPDSPAESDDPDVKVVGPGHGGRKKAKKQAQQEQGSAGAGSGRSGPATAGVGSSRTSPAHARSSAAGLLSPSGSGRASGKGKSSPASPIVLSSESSDASGASETESGADSETDERRAADGVRRGAVSGRKRKAGSLSGSSSAPADGSSSAAPRPKRARSGEAGEGRPTAAAASATAPANSTGQSAKAGSRDRPTNSSGSGNAGSREGEGASSAPEISRSQQTSVPRGAAGGAKAAPPPVAPPAAGSPAAAAAATSTRRGTLLAVAPVPAIGVPNLHLTATDRLRPVKKAEDAGESWLVRLQPYCRILRKNMAARRPDLARDYDLAFSLHPDSAVAAGRIDAGEEGSRLGELLARHGARGEAAAPAAAATAGAGAAAASPGIYFTPSQVAAYFEAAVASGAWAAADAAVAEAEARLAAREAANVARSSGKPGAAPATGHAILAAFPPARSCPVPADPAAAPAARPAGAVWPRVDWIPLDADGVAIPDAELAARGPSAAASAAQVREWMPQLRLYYRLVPKAPAAAPAVSDGSAAHKRGASVAGSGPAASGAGVSAGSRTAGDRSAIGSRSAGESDGHRGH